MLYVAELGQAIFKVAERIRFTMCTSFVLYAGQTYIGMNFDISARPIKLTIPNADQLLVQQKDGEHFYPAFGLNRQGVFMNLQMVAPHPAGMYRRGKQYVHIMHVFADVLSGALAPDAIETQLAGKTIVNVPNHSVHSLVAGPRRAAWVIEPGRGIVKFDAAAMDFLALTNVPLCDVAGAAETAIAGDGADRYQTCYRLLMEYRPQFSIDSGFAVLAATMQTEGDFPTQLSMVAVPEQEQVYFTIGQAVRKRYRFSFADQMIQTEAGFAEPHSRKLDRKGVLLAELQLWQ